MSRAQLTIGGIMLFRKKRRRCTIHFNHEDVARTCNIHRNTIQNIQNRTNKNLRSMSLDELIEFIAKYKKEKKKKD